MAVLPEGAGATERAKDPAEPPAEPPPPAPVGAGGPAPSTEADRYDRLILAGVVALLIVWIPGLGLPLLTPRMAIAVVMAGPGLVVIAGLIRRRDGGARWIGAFIAWAFVAALVSPNPRAALIGSYGSDIGWLWLACFAGAWGLGRRLGAPGRRWLPWVLIGGVAVNAAFGVLEAAFDPGGDLQPAEGRVLGLVTGSLFLAGLLSGGMALLGRMSAVRRERRVPLLVLLVLFAAAVNLTGSRAALAFGAVLAVAGALVAWRDQGAAWTRAGLGALLVAGAVAVGILVSGPLQGDTSSTNRISDVSASSGYESRTMMWGFGLDAVAERPVAGWGPGRFREATGPRTTAAFVRSEGPDKLFYDAHNVFMEHLVGEGVVGLVLLVGFVVTAVRRSRGPLAWFAVGVAVTWLLNPLSACTAPVALVALGASWRRQTTDPPLMPGGDSAAAEPAEPERAVRGRAGTVVGSILLVVGLLIAAHLLLVDALVEQGTSNVDLASLERAQGLYPGDATISATIGDARLLIGNFNTSASERAVVDDFHRATREDPSRAEFWVRRGYADGTFLDAPRARQLDAAERDFRHALELSPWSASAMTGMLQLARLRDEPTEVARWTRRLCAIDLCPTDG